MEINALQSAAYKILNSTLPIEFDFIERVKDVHFTSGTYHTQTLKIKIILSKDWAENNFDNDALKYVSDDLENFGHSLLSPFAMSMFSKKEIETEKVDEYIETILTFLGINPDELHIQTTYIIE